MSELMPLALGDKKVIGNIIRLSNDLLRRNPTVQRVLEGRSPAHTDMGRYGLCLETSDAVTRAAHSLGIVAAREFVDGWHFLTSFSSPTATPSPDDLVIDRTWSQYAPDLHNLMYGRTFIGARAALTEVSADAAVRYKPNSVIYRQVVHAEAPKDGARPAWLNTTHEQLASMGFVMGETEIALPPLDEYQHWS